VFGLTEEELGMASGKITYLGAQTKPVVSVLFSVGNYHPPLELFREFQEGVSYQNDQDGAIAEFYAKPSEMRRFLASVQPMVNRPLPREDERFVSFVFIYDTGNSYDGLEILIHRRHAMEFYSRLLEALSPDNAPGIIAIKRQLECVIPASERKGVRKN
jgi:hypothetical protein